MFKASFYITRMCEIITVNILVSIIKDTLKKGKWMTLYSTERTISLLLSFWIFVTAECKRGFFSNTSQNHRTIWVLHWSSCPVPSPQNNWFLPPHTALPERRFQDGGVGGWLCPPDFPHHDLVRPMGRHVHNLCTSNKTQSK